MKNMMKPVNQKIKPPVTKMKTTMLQRQRAVMKMLTVMMQMKMFLELKATLTVQMMLLRHVLDKNMILRWTDGLHL